MSLKYIQNIDSDCPPPETAFGGTFIPVTISIFVGLSSIGLFIVGGWVIGEKIAFSQTKGHHWFREILSNPKAAFGDHFSWTRSLR
jgi:hypothetical protein